MTHNHRQGKDQIYAEILNRIRTGEQTAEDCTVLENRVRKETDKDLPIHALHINCTNYGVNKINEKKLEIMEGSLNTFLADVTRSGKKMLNSDGTPKSPRLNRDGSIYNTPLQYKLDLKVNAEVMLTYNIDVLDSLANGALGTVVGFETSNNKVKTILVHFKNVKVGQEKRKQNSRVLQEKFPSIPVTPIPRIQFRFNLSKNPASQNDFMLATQFPLKVAFSCTTHKIQGSTIKAPDPLIIDLKSVKEAAQAYVMMSRVQSLEQLFILNEFPQEKIYPSDVAMEELNRLYHVALNEKEKSKARKAMILTFNVRSLLKNYKNISQDKRFTASVIALQETWCDPSKENNNLKLQGYEMHLVSQGRGKGVATYFRPGFQVGGAVNVSSYQMSKVSCKNYDVVNIYRSQNCNKQDFLKDLGSLVHGSKPCFIVGDFNIDCLKTPDDAILKKITSSGFKQIVDFPTHDQGGALDHVYCKRIPFEPKIEFAFSFHSDHAMISIAKP